MGINGSLFAYLWIDLGYFILYNKWSLLQWRKFMNIFLTEHDSYEITLLGPLSYFRRQDDTHFCFSFSFLPYHEIHICKDKCNSKNGVDI